MPKTMTELLALFPNNPRCCDKNRRPYHPPSPAGRENHGIHIGRLRQ